jgi:uncharacterized membrane protein YeaQ/YmgE (transglycosylase-associated protein family)
MGWRYNGSRKGMLASPMVAANCRLKDAWPMTAFLPPFVMDNLWFIFLIASVLTWPMAWLADGAFKDNAFGLMGNYILLMIGSLVGATWLMLHIGSATQVMNQPHLPFFAAVAGASTLILAACFLKRLVTR